MPDAPSSPSCSRPPWRRSGGQQRDGQVQMAEAVTAAMESGQHLLVQAGTGTGKSLAYLVPSLLHEERVVVATATLALQHQLVERDLPRLVEAVKDSGRRHVVRRPQGPLQLRLPPPDPRGRARRAGRPGGRRCPRARSARRCSSCAPGPRRRSRARAAGSATTRRATPTRSGARSASTTASASAPRSAPSARSASPRSPRRRLSAPTWSSPTTRCSRSTRSRACR